MAQKAEVKVAPMVETTSANSSSNIVGGHDHDHVSWWSSVVNKHDSSGVCDIGRPLVMLASNANGDDNS